MIPEVHVSVRIALFQVLAVMLGVIMTRAAFMASGYPKPDLTGMPSHSFREPYRL